VIFTLKRGGIPIDSSPCFLIQTEVLLLVLCNQNTATILANDKFLTLTYIHLTLRRNTVEAATTSITLYGYYCQAIANTATNTIVSRKQTLIDLGLCLLGLGLKSSYLVSSLSLDALQLALLCSQVDATVCSYSLSILQLSLLILDSGRILLQTLLCQLDLQLLILDLLGDGIKLAIVTNIVLLLFVV
jgi:hypothetical protein